ncbi:MAG: citrate synthase [Bacteroidales bacterium]|nr:citrate synthase [Bacteroidales bacterium]
MRLLDDLSKRIIEVADIDKDLFEKYNVKRGLRNSDGSGVLVGLTSVGDVVGYERTGENKLKAIDGQLFYRGIELKDLVYGYQKDNRHGFDETAFLLLTGKLPTKSELSEFSNYLVSHRELPSYFTKNTILSLRGRSIMNMLARSVLVLYTLDSKPEDLSAKNLLHQSLTLIAKFPTIVAYSYHGMRHSFHRESLIIRHPRPDLTTAENFLYMLKGDDFSKLDADILDLLMVTHADHGGGNNSTFTTRVVSSSGTDTYSAIAAALGSLKGPLHGGANQSVMTMMDDIKQNVEDWSNEKEVKDYLIKILKKEANDRSGLIYGMGHAVYTKSDPRTILLKEKAQALAEEKGREEEYHLYELIERLAPLTFYEFKGSDDKSVCANVDFYSGFVYNCIGIPEELYTPMFAIGRICGWCAHRMEELLFSSKRIIRPAYKNVYGVRKYIPMDKR